MADRVPLKATENVPGSTKEQGGQGQVEAKKTNPYGPDYPKG